MITTLAEPRTKTQNGSSWHFYDRAYTTEASTIGLKPGEAPGSRSLPGGRYVLSYDWRTKYTLDNEIMCWEFRHADGTVYTIIND